MRIGIDAHIILPKHKRYDQRIAKYTEELISHLIESDKRKEHTWVLFFDSRMTDTKKFEQSNVEIRHFPFVQYRRYMPIAYSHMLIAGFLRSAKLDIFHSPEGLIPFMYGGNIITSFHYVPRGEREENIFTRTFMLGARAAFAQLCRRAKRIIVNKHSDEVLLHERHGYPKDQIVLCETDDVNQIDWPKAVRQIKRVYKDVAQPKKKEPKRKTKRKAKPKKRKK